MSKSLTSQEQVDQIIANAEEKGIENEFFFKTTLKRYQVQLAIMEDLEEKIKEDGPLVTKEYVKGRGNVYTNPAITEYNKTATAANNTVATLIKIVESFGKKSADGENQLIGLLNKLGEEE